MRKSSKCKYTIGVNTLSKRKYLKPEMAIEMADKINAMPNAIHKTVAYKCTVCHFFHVGRSTELLEKPDLRVKEEGWKKVMEVFSSTETVKGFVSGKTKGGFNVSVFGFETFLPGSQIDVNPITDYDQYVGKTLDVRVIKVHETIKNAVVSHKVLMDLLPQQETSL